MRGPRRCRRWLVLSALLAAGCAGTATRPPVGGVPELVGVPFFAQTAYDCGPAALATVLSAAGVATTPDELIARVYVDGLKGSLQAELMGATRRAGLLPVPVRPDLEGLLGEVASGKPVLVMQNLGLARKPIWHYAVVVGFDAERQRVILRSGAQRQRRERLSRFLRQWQLAGNWGFVAAQPHEIPARTSPDLYMRAVVSAERQLGAAKAGQAYEAALARWPADPLVLFLAAARQHEAAELASAVTLYRRVLAQDPEHAAARNNLANVLLEQGCRAAALREAQRAFALRPASGEFDDAIRDTLRRIEGSPTAASPSAACIAA